MLLVFILSAFTICVASPFHKYPFVFLLDIGNEELGKANTEQIKVTVPGGVLALKYPATDDGPVIGHVRVTGIDFGTDLKASIVEGGPGYRYVVLALTGAPGMQYDTVITIQTLDDDGPDQSKTYEVEEEKNITAEDLNYDKPSLYSKMSANIIQSNSESYEQSESMDQEISQEFTNDDEKYGDDKSIDGDDIEGDDIEGSNDEIDQLGSVVPTSTNKKTDIETHSDGPDDVDAEIDDEINKIKRKSLPNSKYYISVIPWNVLAGYSRNAFIPMYGNMMYQDMLRRQGTIDGIPLQLSNDINNNIGLSPQGSFT